MKRFCIYGNPTIDLISVMDDKGRRAATEAILYGGGSFYSAIPLIERHLEVEVYAVYSHLLVKHPISNYINKRQYSTRANIFRIEYWGDKRKISVLDLAPALYPWNIHEGLCNSIVNPVFQEINSSTLKSIRCRSQLLAVDLQGLLRRPKGGEVVLESTQDAITALELSDVVHSDLEELFALVGTSNIRDAAEKVSKRLKGVLIVTIRPNRSVLISSGHAQIIDLPGDYIAINKTGAGDYFLSTYFYYYAEGRDEEESTYLAHEYTTMWLKSKPSSDGRV